MDYNDQNLIDEACSKRCGLYAKRKITFCNSEFMKPQKTNAVKEFLSINELFGLGTGKKQAHESKVLKNNYDYNPCSPGIPSMWTFSPMEKLHHLLL